MIHFMGQEHQLPGTDYSDGIDPIYQAIKSGQQLKN